MYVVYSYWIQKEIDIAVKYSKPIAGVKLWEAQRVPTAVQQVANKIVGWNTHFIVNAIMRYFL